MIEVFGFDCQYGQDISLFYSIYIGYGAHPVLYPKGTGGSSPCDKPAGGVEADRSPPFNSEE
jgi:hypothetical protein